jgi:hypothetical protein
MRESVQFQGVAKSTGERALQHNFFYKPPLVPPFPLSAGDHHLNCRWWVLLPLVCIQVAKAGYAVRRWATMFLLLIIVK